MVELADSIETYGVLQPIGLREENEHGQFVIVFGERRYRAALLVEGLEKIPALLIESPSPAVQMIENIQRNDLTPVEIGQWIQTRLQDGESSTAVAKMLNKPKDYVSLYKNFAEMPDYLKSLYDQDLCTSARSLVSLQRHAKKNEEDVKIFCEQVVDPITRHDVDEFIQSSKQEKTSDTSPQVDWIPEQSQEEIHTPKKTQSKGVQVLIKTTGELGYLNLKESSKENQVSVIIDRTVHFYAAEDILIQQVTA